MNVLTDNVNTYQKGDYNAQDCQKDGKKGCP
jgi:hypothetical protein